MRACSIVSTPSATTSMPSDLPISMIDATSCRCCRRLDDRHHQLAVDLQPARLQLEQADDRGIAGAEIVDLDVDAELLDLVDVPGDELVALVEEDRLDQLERHRARLDLQLAQALDQVLVVQAARRDVDRDARHVQLVCAPSRRNSLSACSRIDAVDGRDDVELLGDLQEDVGREHAPRSDGSSAPAPRRRRYRASWRRTAAGSRR